MAESEGPLEAGVAHINEHGRKHFDGALECSWTRQKGRILRATRCYEPGDVILVESPLHIVQEKECPAFKRLKELCRDHAGDFDYDPLWYWCALQSLTKEELTGALAQGCTGVPPATQRNLLLLHHEAVTEPSTAARMLSGEIVPNAVPETLEALIQVWVLNCFEYSDEPQGYSTYFFSSFMSHSCYPNAVWYYAVADHVLRCRKAIKVGDEVCISYLPESGLLQSAPSRRMELHETKQFWCDCDRCAPGRPDLSRGMRCPKCTASLGGTPGAVFPSTPPAGPARDGALLASHWVGAVCPTCTATMRKAEAEQLAGLEGKLQAILDSYTKDQVLRSIKDIEAQEALIDEHFAQHVLADLVWEQLCSQCVARKMAEKQRKFLRQRVKFNGGAYEGLSGAHAWAMEALGDALRLGPRRPSTKELQSSNGAWEKTLAAEAAKDKEDARAMYAEAIDILTPMFGEDHEHVADVNEKLIDLDR